MMWIDEVFKSKRNAAFPHVGARDCPVESARCCNNLVRVHGHATTRGEHCVGGVRKNCGKFCPCPEQDEHRIIASSIETTSVMWSWHCSAVRECIKAYIHLLDQEPRRTCWKLCTASTADNWYDDQCFDKSRPLGAPQGLSVEDCMLI